jgi:hypothetical protein
MFVFKAIGLPKDPDEWDRLQHRAAGTSPPPPPPPAATDPSSSHQNQESR